MNSFKNSLTILSKIIRQDAEGRFCLNDCHKAAGGDKTKQPANFMRLDTTQGLIQELAENPRSSDLRNDRKQPFFEVVKTIRGGAHQGTYVVRELVYAYAI